MTEIFYDKNAEVDQGGEKQDLGVYEARQINKQYDDNWNLIRYTSELRNEKDDSFFAYIEFEGDEGSIKNVHIVWSMAFIINYMLELERKVNLQHRMMTRLAHVMNVGILCLSIQHIMNLK